MIHTHISHPLNGRQSVRLRHAARELDKSGLLPLLLRFARMGKDFSWAFEQDPVLLAAAQEVMFTQLYKRMGSVYVAAHPELPGLVKVGLTRKSVETRIAALTTAGFPGRYVLLKAVSVIDAPSVESQVHRALRPWRRERELFTISPEKAIAEVVACARKDNAALCRRLNWVLPEAVLVECPDI